jgi:hypothetical protein
MRGGSFLTFSELPVASGRSGGVYEWSFNASGVCFILGLNLPRRRFRKVHYQRDYLPYSHSRRNQKKFHREAAKWIPVEELKDHFFDHRLGLVGAPLLSHRIASIALQLSGIADSLHSHNIAYGNLSVT